MSLNVKKANSRWEKKFKVQKTENVIQTVCRNQHCFKIKCLETTLIFGNPSSCSYHRQTNKPQTKHMNYSCMDDIILGFTNLCIFDLHMHELRTLSKLLHFVWKPTYTQSAYVTIIRFCMKGYAFWNVNWVWTVCNGWHKYNKKWGKVISYSYYIEYFF